MLLPRKTCSTLENLALTLQRCTWHQHFNVAHGIKIDSPEIYPLPLPTLLAESQGHTYQSMSNSITIAMHWSSWPSSSLVYYHHHFHWDLVQSQSRTTPSPLNVKCRKQILNSECRMLNAKCQMLYVNCQMSNVESRISNIECWISFDSSAKCWMSNV